MNNSIYYPFVSDEFDKRAKRIERKKRELDEYFSKKKDAEQRRKANKKARKESRKTTNK